MDHWNYRVVRHNKNGEVYFGIHEVYYNENGEIEAYSMESVSPVADDINGLIEIIERLKDATFKPCIEAKDLFS